MRGLMYCFLLSVWGCNLSSSVDLDGRARGDADSHEHVGTDADAMAGDEDADQSTDVSREPGPSGSGAMTFVASTVEILTERLCDLDGDGLADNAWGALSETDATISAGALSGFIESDMAEGDRYVLHLPLVGDLSGPTDDAAILIAFRGKDDDDDDDPHSREDDLSGSEPYRARGNSLDPCGEPLFALVDVSITDGELAASNGSISVPAYDSLVLRSATAWGHLERGGDGAEITLCGGVLASDAGELGEDTILGGFSNLEAIVAGGRLLGIPTVSGLSPDVDLDGDGLERFEVDHDGRMTRCIDGDSTVIEGRDCWADERIADAFAVTMRIWAVSALFAGLHDDWRNAVDDEWTCDPLPESSLFDPN